MSQVNQAPSPLWQAREASLLAKALFPVSADLAQLRTCLPGYIPIETEASREILAHVLSSQGKLIRPAMFLLACKMLAYRGEHLLPIAAVCEFVHTASLLHDDVVDNSKTRRNKPTANTIWGDEAAVLTGDLIYATASEMMANTGKLEIVKTFAAAIREMSEGELLQLEHIFNPNMSQDTYFKIVGGKTAVLMGAACRAAAILAEAGPAQKEALEAFGYAVGIAFQLIDDALDYCGSEAVFGKETLFDLREGKVTLPVIFLQDHLTEGERSLLDDILTKKDLLPEDVKKVAALVGKYQTPAKVIAVAHSYTQKALNSLQGHFAPSPERAHLESLVQSLLHRLQ